MERRVRAGDDAVSTDLGEPGETEFLSLGTAHDDHRGCAIGDLRGRSGRDGAVLGEGRAQAGKRLHGGVGADALVTREDDRVTLALGDLHGDDLLVEDTCLLRGRRQAM